MTFQESYVTEMDFALNYIALDGEHIAKKKNRKKLVAIKCSANAIENGIKEYDIKKRLKLCRYA